MSMALRRSTTIFLANLRRAPVPPPSWSATRSFTTKLPLGDAEDAVLEPPLLTGVRRGWLGKEDDRFLYFRMDMPGLAQEHVRFNIDNNNNNNSLVIQGEKQDNEMGFGEVNANNIVGRRKYTAKIVIPPNSFITDQLATQMNNGVLNVKIPKVTGAAGNNLVQFDVPNMNENPFLVDGVRDYAKEVKMKFENSAIKVFDTIGDERRMLHELKIFTEANNPVMEEIKKCCERVDSVGLVVRIDMPGLGFEHLNVFREADTVVVEGNGKKDFDEIGGSGSRRHVKCRVDIAKYYKTSRLCNIKDGVCSLTVPPRLI